METFTEVYESLNTDRQTPNVVESKCVLCSGHKLCEICYVKQTYKDELMIGTRDDQLQLSEIENILLSLKKLN